jgi:hypothetical protein
MLTHFTAVCMYCKGEGQAGTCCPKLLHNQHMQAFSKYLGILL